MIERKLFGSFGGKDCYLYVLKGDGIEVGITDFGAAVQFIRLKTNTGVRDVALGYSTIEERIDSGSYCGATIGRVANRIGGARFTLGGRDYKIAANDGQNANHGGVEGFDQRLFSAQVKGDILKLTLESPDGDQGFPGRLTLSVEYQLKGKSLEVGYTAVSDRDTLWAPTCHIYFNLDGEASGSALGTVLEINADRITLLDKDHIATGEIVNVKGTPFDFTKPKEIARDIGRDDCQLVWAGGYDANFILKGEHAATAVSADGKTGLDIYTDMPGLQLYSGNYIGGRGKTGEYKSRDGIALEPQFFPNAVNIKDFVSPEIKAGKPYRHYIKYKFDLTQ